MTQEQAQEQMYAVIAERKILATQFADIKIRLDENREKILKLLDEYPTLCFHRPEGR
jgi:hypothetical protein